MAPIILPLEPIELRSIVLSHSFFELAPIIANPGPPHPLCPTITRPYHTPEGDGVFQIEVVDDTCVLRALVGDPNPAAQVAHRCLSLDQNITPFRQCVAINPQFAWINDLQLGRYLCSPTLFEDAYKIMTTTNTNWQNTIKVVRKTVDVYGVNVGGAKAFPLPSEIVQQAKTGKDIDQAIGSGYRGVGLLDLCKQAQANPGFWLGPDWQQSSPEEFRQQLRSVEGLGPMCASYLGRFYGKPNTFTIDSWVRKRCKELWGWGKKEMKAMAQQRYEKFGEWAPNALWFEITRYWHDMSKFDGKWY